MPPRFIRVDIRLNNLRKFRRMIIADLRNSENGPVRQALSKWSQRYRNFLQKRWRKASRGSGLWRKLKPSTIARKGHKLILIETKALYNALDPAFAYKGTKHGPGFVATGFDETEHPNAKMPMRKLAAIHHFGKGNVPARKIMVRPDPETRRLMLYDMNRAVKRMIKETTGQDQT